MLSIENERQLNILSGCVRSETSGEIVYKCSDYHTPETEGALQWDDPDIGIEWPLKGNPTLSEKDALAPLLKDFESPFIFGKNA